MKQISLEFNRALENLDMFQDSNLIYVNKLESITNNQIRFALENAKKYKADAVYFRFIKETQKYIPQIYIYDFTSVSFNTNIDTNISELHKKLWNSGHVPLFFIFMKTEVKFFNCLKSPEKYDNKLVSKPLETISILSKIDNKIKNTFENFSAKLFANGSFWEQSIYKEKFNVKDTAYEKLLQHLKVCRKKLIDENIFYDQKLANKFILMSILVKYLEEREDDEGNKVFPNNFFIKLSNSNNFEEILRKGSLCLNLFDYLSEHFNGKIFEWTEEEKNILQKTDFNIVADFISSKTELNGQINFFNLYSFNDLPIELISNIYEEFSSKKENVSNIYKKFSNKKEKDGIVYTPAYLVNFLVDQCMPIDEAKDNFKILDPACGSGVFLVATFKRLVEWWRIKNNFKEPNLKELRKILLENIYGFDIESEAVKVSIFSLSLAICDFLSPKVIWEELKFESLSDKNIISKDFFKVVFEDKISKDFDLIIGNPPFVESLGEFGDKIEKNKYKNEIKIPGKQRALLFLEESIKLCKEKALLCLILPSSSLLYNQTSFDFRKNFFEKYNIPQIIDFSHIRRVLFGKDGDTPVSALFVKNELRNNNDLLNVIVKRTKSSKEKIYFELDHYDFHYVKKDIAINNKYIWKANFLGGGRLIHIINRLTNIERTFGNYLDEKVKNHGWFFAEGFIKGKRTDILQEAVDRQTLPTEAFNEKGIDISKFDLLKTNSFKSPSVSQIFEPPHILIKELLGKNTIPIELVDYYLSFKHRIIGIHANENERKNLEFIVNRIRNNKIILFLILCISSESLLNKSSSILKKDIEQIPFPEDEKELELSKMEQIICDDVLEYITEFARVGENSQIVNKTDNNLLHDFGQIYCDVLNSVYKDTENEFKPLEFIKKDSFVIYTFFYGNYKPNINLEMDNVEQYINNLLENKITNTLKINRVLRIYDNNIIILIKPNQIRYWLKSIAIRDADETFLDLYKQGF